MAVSATLNLFGIALLRNSRGLRITSYILLFCITLDRLFFIYL